jgi:hypothetical protein
MNNANPVLYKLNLNLLSHQALFDFGEIFYQRLLNVYSLNSMVGFVISSIDE